MIRVGIIGLGHWGPNYARLLSGGISGARVVALCDTLPDRLQLLSQQHPLARAYASHDELLASAEIDAVIVCTPASTHRAIVQDCLVAGVDVLVEKPIATTSEDAIAMSDAADRTGRILMVGHTFLFNPAVQRIRELIGAGQLGRVLYLYFHRTGLGPIRQDVNALWDLAPHDITMLRYWLNAEPLDVVAHGQAFLRDGCEDVVFVNLSYPGGIIASIHVSWLDPVKVRRATIVGDKRMAVFDDVHPSEKLRLYDKGASYQPSGGEFGEFVASVRDGDIVIPRIPNREPLREELQHFIACVERRERPVADGKDGASVVRILEAAERSLRSSANVRGAP